MNIAAIIVLFEPETIGIQKIVSNIKSYCEYCNKIYIIDNSENLHKQIAENIYNCVYISNKNIGGIAKAQNIGCQQAFNDGFQWVLTMDQDSFFDREQIQNYISQAEKYIKKDKNIVLLGPKIKNLNETIFWTKQIRFKILSPLKRKILGKKYTPKFIPDIEEKDRLISSGNILNLYAWKDVNGFDEFLFIDQVDYDLCHKIKRNGKKIIQFNKIYLNHRNGEKQKFTLLIKHQAAYTPFRLYHIFRNIFIEIYRFPEYKNFLKKELKEYYWDSCVNSLHCFRNIKIYKKAKKDFFEYINSNKEIGK